MLDTAPTVKSSDSRRVLGSEPAGVVFALLALVITAGIVLLQLNLRAGQYEPQYVPIFYRLFAFEDYLASFLFMAALLIAAVPEAQQVAARVAGTLGEHPVITACATTVLLAAGALWAYHAHPLSMDEAAPYMQSRIFAEGKLLGRYPPELLDWLVHQPFQNYFIHVSRQTGEIASSYWPGFALLLTPFMALGVPWLCNPVLGGLSVWVIHRLTLNLTQSRQAAGAAALFSLASAAFVVNAFSFYSMSAHLLCNAVFALLLLQPTPLRCFFAGFVGGLALTLHNPIPHMLFAAAWLAWLVTQRQRWALLASIVAGYLPWVVFVGFGWSEVLQGLAGSASAATAAVADHQSQLASAFERLAGVFKLPRSIDLWNRVIASAKVWLWAAPLLVLLAGVGFWRHRRDTHFRLLLASAVITFVAYVFVPLTQGHGWGYRYFHSVWFVLPLFAGAALIPARGVADQDKSARTSSFARWALGGAIGGLVLMLPYFVWQVHAFIGAHLAQIPHSQSGEARVVFINPSGGYYNVDLVQNDPFMRAQPVMMVTHGLAEENQFMAEHFPDLTLLARDQRGAVWGVPDAGAAVPQEPRKP